MTTIDIYAPEWGAIFTRFKMGICYPGDLEHVRMLREYAMRLQTENEQLRADITSEGKPGGSDED
jgi:hypothetical protein